jgi:hypothetical protein
MSGRAWAVGANREIHPCDKVCIGGKSGYGGYERRCEATWLLSWGVYSVLAKVYEALKD